MIYEPLLLYRTRSYRSRMSHHTLLLLIKKDDQIENGFLIWTWLYGTILLERKKLYYHNFQKFWYPNKISVTKISISNLSHFYTEWPPLLISKHALKTAEKEGQKKSMADRWQMIVTGSVAGLLTADRAWPGHGPWWKGTGLGCTGWFCWAGPSLHCCCCCCSCCSGWVEPWGVATEQQVAGIQQKLGWIQLQDGCGD